MSEIDEVFSEIFNTCKKKAAASVREDLAALKAENARLSKELSLMYDKEDRQEGEIGSLEQKLVVFDGVFEEAIDALETLVDLRKQMIASRKKTRPKKVR